MIARVAIFKGLTPAQKEVQVDNYQRRFKAALLAQPGITAILHLEGEDGDVMSISLWETQEAMQEGGRRANQVPLLPDQVGEDIPSPTQVEVWQVRDSWAAD